jgi:ketosteroid isomerase-like protein
MTNEAQIKGMVESWAKAVREKDMEGIMAWHHADITMYDVPPPFQSTGIEAYLKTWNLFYSCEQEKDSFRIVGLHIEAGEEVAFCYAAMKCAYYDKEGQKIDLDFRLTIGFRKISGQWWFMHEHHSLPAY